MNWRNWKNHPFIFTLVGALSLGYLVRKFTEPAPYRHTYDASRPVATTPALQSASTPAPTPALKLVSTPAPVLVTPAAQPAPAATRPMASSPSTFSPPVDLPYNSTTRVSSGRRGYTTYTFKLGEVSYQLDGKASFDHLGEMKQQCESLDAQKSVLETAIEADERNITEMKRRLSVARATLDRTSQDAIDTFNAQIEAQGELIDSFNRKVEELNALNDRRKAIFASMHVYAQQHRL